MVEMSSDRHKRLGEILGAKGYVTEARISQLLSRAQNAGKKIGEILVEEGYITEEVLASALDEQRKDQQDR
jgi:mannitol/fructose-specific phosphotransferase system IIA component